MKTLNLFITLTLASVTLFAQSSYKKTMSGTIMEMYQAEDLSTQDQLINKFNRIAQAESDKWEPRYYEALTHVFKSMRIQDLATKDAVLDQAHVALKAATAIDDNNSEIVALQGFVDMMKIAVDPGTRGQTLSPKIMAAFGHAMALDPENPRATLFMAQMQIGTAQFFGSPITESCSMISKSEQLFKDFKPKSSLSPMWGEESLVGYKEMCSPENSGE